MLAQHRRWVDQAEVSGIPAPPKGIDFTWGMMIPMRDGVELNATLYRPQDANQPLPVIFTLTPYIADSYHPRANYFAQNGYAFALVDCRGRGNSGGEFEPFANEAADGHDISQWLAAQPWCNGTVTMWGGSYGGYDQWLTLREGPAGLKTIVPVASAHAGVDFPFYKNIWFSYELQWLTLTSGRTGNSLLFQEQSFWIDRFRRMYLEHRPYQELDQIVNNRSTCFQTWIQHPIPDDYWDQMALSPADYDRIDVPILSITGHYDGDQPGAMHYYRQHMRSESPAKEQHYLIIGPWDHAGTRTPQRSFGGLTIGEASLLDMNELHKAWYDWTLKDGPKPEFLKQRVAYYLMGADEWRYADSLEAISDHSMRLYLDSQNGRANDVFQSGTLSQTPAAAGTLPDQYEYDPLDTRPEILWREEIKAYLTDQREALHLFGNGLIYHSAPIDRDTEVTGHLKLELWLEMDVPDADFQVSVYEIRLNGDCQLLSEDMLRARYRESLRQQKLVRPGEISLYSFDGFTFFSRRIAQGSRLRLLIRCPNNIYIEKNYNHGGVIASASGADTRTAHIRLHHDPQYPSFLELPIVTAAAAAETTQA